jgi:2-dehydropantoate 2-reductase
MGKRIVVVGAGAVGGYFGGYLSRHGHDVTLVDAWPAHVETMRRDGLEIAGMDPADRLTVAVDAIHPNDVQGFVRQRPVDIAVIAVKSYDTEWATALIRPYLAETGYVVSLQNGVNEDRIAALVGWGRTVGCVVANASSELVGPGRISRYYPRGDAQTTVFRVGEAHGRITRRVEEFAEIAGSADSTKVTTNLWGERWSKLCVNAMRNGLSAASGLSGNDLARVEPIRRFGILLGGQAVRVGQAHGFVLGSVLGLDPERLACAAEGAPDALAEIEAQMLAAANSGKRSEAQRPSMGQDIRRGRRTEIDFINGLVVARGREAGVPVAAHEAVVGLVRRVERGETEPSPAWFESFAADGSLS